MANAQHVAGTWNIDPTHTTLSFTARHAMVTKVRGQFNEFEGVSCWHRWEWRVPNRVPALT